MKKWLFTFATVLAGGIGNAASGGLTLEERLSFFFREIAVTNGDSMALTVDSMEGGRVLARVGMTGCFHSVETGYTFVVQRGIPFCFRHTGGACADLTLVDAMSLTNGQMRVPGRFGQEDCLLLFKDDQGERLISTKQEEAYSCGEGMFEPFKFPFRRVWRDEHEFSLWCAGQPYRHRMDEVKKMVETEKTIAEDFLRILVEKSEGEVRTALEGQGPKRIKISIEDGVELKRLANVRDAIVQIGDTENGRAIVGIGIKPLGESGCAYRYKFDSRGHLRWFYSANVVMDGSGGRKSNGHRMFELDGAGKIRRAFITDVLPLLIVTARTYFFTGDGELVRQFMLDFGKAMEETATADGLRQQ